MSFELKYTKEGNLFTRTVEPAGQFSIITTRQNHRYYEEFSGTMTLSKDDFTWVMEAGPCTEIYITCQFHRLWKGVFSHADCTVINRAKRFLEVQPLHDDEYSKIEPWMGLEMNIIPPFEGIKSKTNVLSLNQYEIQSRTIRITAPYTGPNAAQWNGYSVNDWIRTNGVIPTAPYRGDRQVYNSLIHKITGGKTYFDTSTNPDAWNRLVWLDALGCDLMNADIVPSGFTFVNRYWRESMFTLAEVINFYKEDGTWEYCDLVYKRELSDNDRDTVPPSGRNFAASTLNSDSEGASGNINTGRWIYNVAERKWIRRYLGLHERGTQGGSNSNVIPDNAKTGDGFDFTPLIDMMQDGRKIKKQVLFRNKYEEEDSGPFWYRTFYGFAFYNDHFHKIKPLFEKFITFVKTKEATTSLVASDIESRFFFDEDNPYTGTRNIWKNVLIAQNSDIKRPLSSERATREMMSFTDFLNLLCTMTNTAWAIIDGKFVIEHVSYFESGLTYDSFDLDVPVLNPFSIFNVAKNKGFMGLTDIYRYDKRMMPKYEVFKTVGGEEPHNNNLTIEYKGGCINNKPNENITETDINTTTDYNYARSDGRDEGITLILTQEISVMPGYNGNVFMPVQDEYGRYIYNATFTLENIIRDYHNWGRVLSQATLNDSEWENLIPFKNIIQNVSFPYKKESPDKAENPYILVRTGIGIGIINRSEYTTKEGWMNYELRFNSIEELMPPSSTVDWHVHNQLDDASVWEVKHSMNTVFIMRPVVFDVSGNEIEYNSFRVLGPNTLELTFTAPVGGEAHFIALNVPPENLYKATCYGYTSWSFSHGLNATSSEIVLSPFLDFRGNEVHPNSIKYTDANTIQVTFVSPVACTVAVAKVVEPYASAYSANISGANVADLTKTPGRVYNKPLVLQAGEEIFYNSHKLLSTLRRIGFSENVIATIVVMEKNKN